MSYKPLGPVTREGFRPAYLNLVRNAGSMVVAVPYTDADTVRAKRAGHQPALGDTVYSGYGSVFDHWYPIRENGVSFLERVERGAFSRATSGDPADVKALYAHGRDALLGGRPVGLMLALREDDVGLGYRVRIFGGTMAAQELQGPLTHGLLQSSIGFSVLSESYTPPSKVKRSDYNDGTYGERRIHEIALREISLTPFGAAGKAAGAQMESGDATPSAPSSKATPPTPSWFISSN